MTKLRLFAIAFLAAAPAALAGQQPPTAPPTPPPAAAPAAADTALPQSVSARPVTLQQALDLGRQNNPSMVQAQQNVRIADMGTMQAWGAYLPSISGSGSASRSSATRQGQSGTATTFANTDASSFGLSASLNLFTGFQRGANRRLASATADMNRAALLQQTYATDLATKQAFFNALATQELVRVAQTQVRRSQENLKLTTEKLRLGAATRADSLQASVDFGTQQLALIQAVANALTAQANLARAIGVPGNVAAVPDTTLEVRLTSLDTTALRREAEESSPAIVQAEASVTAARASVAASRSPLMPTVSVGASQTWLGSQLPWNAAPLNMLVDRTVTPAETTFARASRYTGSWSVRLSLSYPIFNGFQREAGMVQADANLVANQAKLRDTRLLMDANITQAMTALDAAGQQIDVARTSVAAAQENLRMQQERYRLGASTIVDLLTAEVTLNQAEVSLVQARYNYLVARAQLEAYVGHSL